MIEAAPLEGPKTPLAVRVRDLRKSYGEVQAVRGISLEIPRGSVAALLGPNGAGKTTTLEIIEGLRRADSGEVEVLGTTPEHARRRVGVQLQESALYEDLTCNETIRLFGRLYGYEADATALLQLVEMGDVGDRRATNLSGGQKRRLQIALTLCNDPELVVLDEPTTGLDPIARRQTWAMIRALHDQGRTVVLTTHYIEEADQLAEMVWIIDQGQVMAEGSPSDLVGELGAAANVSVAASQAAELDQVAGVVRGEWRDGRWELQTREVGGVLREIAARVGEESLRDVSVRPPTLEDVFLRRTGKRLGEDGP